MAKGAGYSRWLPWFRDREPDSAAPSHRVASDGGLNRILDIGDVDLEARRLFPVHGEIQIGLSNHAEHSQVLDALYIAHDSNDLIGFFLKESQVVPVNFNGELALNAADCFFHVVRNRLREIP